ncbi:hypothetical protein ACS0PU_011944 [Formica fusca]
MTDLLQHSCFNEYNEAINTIIIDENNVVTIGNKPSIDVIDNLSQSEEAEITTDELLIACVAQKPALYDHRLPLADRTLFKKNALWQEICNMMGGIMDITTAKKRWKYLKDCYTKDKKKSNEYIPSGSAALSTRKNTFRFYEAMNFLSDCMETRQTVTTSPKISSVSSISPSLSSSPSSPLSPISLHIPSTSGLNVSKNRYTAPISPAGECSTSSSNSSSNFHLSKKRKSSKTDLDNLEETFIKTLMAEPVVQNDPIHGFVLSLADGLCRLPYKLQIEFLSRILEVQNNLDSEL